MIHNTIITLNWCFIVINDVKNIIESFALLFLLRSLQINFSIFFVWIVKFKITDFCINFEHQFINTTIMRLNAMFVNHQQLRQKSFDTLFNCIRFDVSNWWIDRWKFILTFVCATNIMKARKLVYFFWITSSSALLSYTSIFVNARTSLISLSMLNVAFMNKTKLISKFNFQCSCLKVNMTKQQQQI